MNESSNRNGLGCIVDDRNQVVVIDQYPQNRYVPTPTTVQNQIVKREY